MFDDELGKVGARHGIMVGAPHEVAHGGGQLDILVGITGDLLDAEREAAVRAINQDPEIVPRNPFPTRRLSRSAKLKRMNGTYSSFLNVDMPHFRKESRQYRRLDVDVLRADVPDVGEHRSWQGTLPPIALFVARESPQVRPYSGSVPWKLRSPNLRTIDWTA